MSILPYTQGYPPDGYTLGQTKTVIRNNLDGTFLTLAVDHVDNNGQPGTNPAGYHTIIHEVPQTSVNTVTGYNQLFSGVPGALVVNSVTTPAIPPNLDTQLYSLTALGGLSQLTGNSTDATGGIYEGYCWMGGILMQWGFTAVSVWDNIRHTTNFTTPNVSFPNAGFVVLTTFTGDSFNSTGDINIQFLSKNGFNWVFTGSITNTSFTGFYWLVIGN